MQSDCCDSLTSIKSQHNYTETYEQAVAAGFKAGLSLCFGCDPNIDKGPSGNASSYLRSALRAGLVEPEQLRLAVARIMLTRFRLGEFYELEGGGLPWEVDEALIDSAMHRALAREAAAASVPTPHKPLYLVALSCHSTNATVVRKATNCPASHISHTQCNC